MRAGLACASTGETVSLLRRANGKGLPSCPPAWHALPMIAAIAHLGLMDDEEITLDTAALELSALDHDGVDMAPYLAMLADLANDLGRYAGVADSVGQADGLVEVIAGSHGFRGDSESYDVPLNADMIRVLDRRRGLPIALSILYVALARRIGWKADILDVPGHVLVRLGAAEEAITIDPFNGGALVGRHQLLALLQRMLGPDATVDRYPVLPMSNRMILARLLRNQARRAESANDLERARIVNERIVTVAPADQQGWWDLARMQLALGRGDDARLSLSAMLEMTRDAAIRMRIAAALDTLAAR